MRYTVSFNVELRKPVDKPDIAMCTAEVKAALPHHRVTNVTLTPVPESVTGRVAAGEVEHG